MSADSRGRAAGRERRGGRRRHLGQHDRCRRPDRAAHRRGARRDVAGARRTALEELRTNLLPAIERGPGGQPITAPTLDGSYLAERWPSLFDYNLATYAPFFGDGLRGISLVRTAAMHPWPAPGVATVPSLRDAVSPAFRELLLRDATVRRHYLGRTLLRTIPSTGDFPTASLSPTDRFDPESWPRLLVALEPAPGQAGEARLVLSFTSDFGAHDYAALIVLRTGERAEADLRQIVAYALSRYISGVHIRPEGAETPRLTFSLQPPR